MQKLSYLPSEKIVPVWENEDLFNMRRLLNKKHSAYLENEVFDVESGFSKEQIQIRVSLKKQDDSAFYPIECIFIKEIDDKIKDSEIAMSILDYLDIYWTDYFTEERNVFIPLDWSKHEFEGIVFYIRGFIRNLKLETEADAFLQKHGHGEYDIHSISSET